MELEPVSRRQLLDLYVEFRNALNGLEPPCGFGLVGALAHFGLDTMNAVEKKALQEIIAAGGPFTPAQRFDILDYCASDVQALVALFGKMSLTLDVPRALLRGRYMVAAAHMEHNGIPIDTPVFDVLRLRWAELKERLIRDVNEKYGVYEGVNFKLERFEQYLTRQGIPWPRLESGALSLDDDTFRDMARVYPQLGDLRELRASLSQLRLQDLAMGSDGRNRTLLSAFRSKTGRNQPSATKFIFGNATWVRSLIKPTKGHAVAYLDYEQQEFGIAAALSRDENMIHAYESGDPYLAFAKLAGAVPPDGRREDYEEIRDLFKACVLGVQYSMEAEALAVRIGKPRAYAAELLRLHRRVFRRYWEWSQGAVDHATAFGWLQTRFGWKVRVDSKPNTRSLRNFPMQANGAEVLRIACCLATERGLPVCAPIHDALLVEATLAQLDDIVSETQRAMAEASAIVLGKIRLRVEAKVVRHPDRFVDKRGREMWSRITGLLSAAGAAEPR